MMRRLFPALFLAIGITACGSPGGDLTGARNYAISPLFNSTFNASCNGCRTGSFSSARVVQAGVERPYTDRGDGTISAELLPGAVAVTMTYTNSWSQTAGAFGQLVLTGQGQVPLQGDAVDVVWDCAFTAGSPTTQTWQTMSCTCLTGTCTPPQVVDDVCQRPADAGSATQPVDLYVQGFEGLQPFPEDVYGNQTGSDGSQKFDPNAVAYLGYATGYTGDGLVLYKKRDVTASDQLSITFPAPAAGGISILFTARVYNPTAFTATVTLARSGDNETQVQVSAGAWTQISTTLSSATSTQTAEIQLGSLPSTTGMTLKLDEVVISTVP